MNQLSPVRRMVTAALCIALCVVLPIAFHSIPNAGSVFLPMHIPVLLCGLACSWPYGLVCGLAGRLVSGMAKALILTPGMAQGAWVTANFVTALPGIVIQLILLPQVVRILMKAGVIPAALWKMMVRTSLVGGRS